MVSEELKEETIEQCMEMLLHAGEARKKIGDALDLSSEGSHEEADKLLDEAKLDINKGHKIQTTIIQREAREEEYYYSMLFSHAQDTLMTIQSEYIIGKKIVKIVKRLEERIK